MRNSVKGRPRLAIIGAGPKGISIAAKTKVLESFFRVPDLFVFDRSCVAAAWSGDYGFTDGTPLLGTPPEKDIGFPYASNCWRRNDTDQNGKINLDMLTFCWQRFLVATRHRGLADWVDRVRVPPSHREWFDYLYWAWNQTSAKVTAAELREIDLKDGLWKLNLSDSNKKPMPSVSVDGLVITGTGPCKRIENQPERAHPSILDGRSFWQPERMERILIAKKPRIALVGKGETAAAIAHTLLGKKIPDMLINLIGGPIHSRGEGYYENRVFTDPDGHNWSNLDPELRRAFVSHTDQGVFSQHASELLRLSKVDDSQFRWSPGRVVNVETDTDDDRRVLLTIRTTDVDIINSYSFLIVATGFESLWFRDLMTPSAGAALDLAIKCTWKEATPKVYRETLEQSIARDLSVKDLIPRLHLPMLAGFAQGPGFPNLSCLGLLSDRILHPYTDSDSSL